MKKVYLLITLLLLIHPLSTLGGMISDEIRNQCPDQYFTHKDVVHEYSVRMQDYVEKFGCEIIEIYAVFAEENMEIIELLQDDELLMESIVGLFADIPDFIPVLKRDPKILNSILLISQIDKTAFDNLKEVCLMMSRVELRNMERDPRYFLYIIVANMMNSGEEDASALITSVKRLKKDVSVNDIETYMFLLNISTGIYPDISTAKRSSYIDLALTTIGKKNLRKLQRYQQYLVCFLPPDISDIPESQNLSRIKLEKIQRDYVDLMTHIYAIGELSKTNLGLLMVEMLSGFVLDALRYHDNPDEIKKYLSYQFKSPVFPDQHQFCNIDYQGKLELFFRMYSPQNKKNSQSISGTVGNLGLIAKWYSRDSGRKFIKSVQPSEWEHFSQSMGYLPEIYFSLNCKQVKVFDDLLLNLSTDSVTNGLFIILLSQESIYFEWVNTNREAFSLIRHNENDIYGQTAKKYKYIFLTSFPKDSDLSLFLKFSNEEKVPVSDIYQLMYMDNKALSKHNFTDFEKYCSFAEDVYNTVDNVIFVASILAVPITAGASIAVVAMQASRKGAKRAAKQALRKLSRRSAKSVCRLVKLGSRKGRKVAWRELKELTGIAVKRGRKTLQHSMQSNIYKAEVYSDAVGVTRVVYSAAAAYYLSQSIVDSGMDDICPELVTQD